MSKQIEKNVEKQVIEVVQLVTDLQELRNKRKELDDEIQEKSVLLAGYLKPASQTNRTVVKRTAPKKTPVKKTAPVKKPKPPEGAHYDVIRAFALEKSKSDASIFHASSELFPHLRNKGYNQGNSSYYNWLTSLVNSQELAKHGSGNYEYKAAE